MDALHPGLSRPILLSNAARGVYPVVMLRKEQARAFATAVLGGLLLTALPATAQKAGPAKPGPAADAVPVKLGDSMASVIQTLGAPLGIINRGGQSAMMYREGEIEIRNGIVSRLRWKGQVVRDTGRKVTLARDTAGEITFRRADPNAVRERLAAEKAAEAEKNKQVSSRIRVVGTHQTNELARVEAPAPQVAQTNTLVETQALPPAGK